MTSQKNILVVGNSHINSLRLSEDAVSAISDNSKVSYLTSSQACWICCVARRCDRVIEFERDPLEIIAEMEGITLQRLPDDIVQVCNDLTGAKRKLAGNIRQIYNLGEPLPDKEDIDIVVLAGLAPQPRYFSKFFDRYQTESDKLYPDQTPVSYAMTKAVKGLDGSPRLVFRPPWLERIDPEKRIAGLPSRFELFDVLDIISSSLPSSKKVLIATPPPFGVDHEVADEQAIRSVIRFNSYLTRRCQEHDFVFMETPKDALSGSGLFTKPQLSRDPARTDLHLGREYGEMLWDGLAALIRADAAAGTIRKKGEYRS